jgi:serine acetyltransferase
MLDSSLAFSDLPIRLLFAVGMLALAVAVGYGAIVLLARLTGLIVEPGYAPTVLLISGFGALNALGLSVVGAYAWRAFENTKGRPLATAAAVHVRGGRRAVSVFRHPQAICESKKVGPRTRVWAFAHVLPGARIGADCNICDHTFIENDVTLGDRVTVKCGVQLWDGVRIEDDVFIGTNATFSNDRFPRSKRRPKAFLQTAKEGASIGANATTSGHHNAARWSAPARSSLPRCRRMRSWRGIRRGS